MSRSTRFKKMLFGGGAVLLSGMLVTGFFLATRPTEGEILAAEIATEYEGRTGQWELVRLPAASRNLSEKDRAYIDEHVSEVEQGLRRVPFEYRDNPREYFEWACLTFNVIHPFFDRISEETRADNGHLVVVFLNSNPCIDCDKHLQTLQEAVEESGIDVTILHFEEDEEYMQEFTWRFLLDGERPALPISVINLPLPENDSFSFRRFQPLEMSKVSKRNYSRTAKSIQRYKIV